MKLTIGLATRGRPGLLARTVAETMKHIVRPDTKLVILADDDDYGTRSVMSKISEEHHVVWSFAPRPDSLGEKYNRMMSVAPADVYMVMVDYAPCMTDGFDEKVIEAAQVYPDGYAVIVNYLANLSFSQLNAVTHKLAEKMGGIYPEYFPYWFIDHWLEEMAKRIGRQVFVDVFMDCSHRPGTMDKYEPYLWGCLFEWRAGERHQMAFNIINSPDFNETPERKRALVRNFPLWEGWSAMINGSLRNDDNETINTDDERYMRIRKKAIDFLEQAKLNAEADRQKAA